MAATKTTKKVATKVAAKKPVVKSGIKLTPKPKLLEKPPGVSSNPRVAKAFADEKMAKIQKKTLALQDKALKNSAKKATEATGKRALAGGRRLARQVAVLTDTLQAKLGSLLVHVDEYLSPGGHQVDREAICDLIRSDEVAAWLEDLETLGVLPQKRDKHNTALRHVTDHLAPVLPPEDGSREFGPNGSQVPRTGANTSLPGQDGCGNPCEEIELPTIEKTEEQESWKDAYKDIKLEARINTIPRPGDGDYEYVLFYTPTNKHGRVQSLRLDATDEPNALFEAAGNLGYGCKEEDMKQFLVSE